MKNLLFFFLIPASTCYGQLSGLDTHISDFGLKGQVKSLSQKTYYSEPGETKLQDLTSDSAKIDFSSMSGFSFLDAEFAQDGNVFSKRTNTSYFNEEGILKPNHTCEIYKYDDQNNWVYYREYDVYLGEAYTGGMDSVIYNDAGNLIKHVRYYEHKLIYTRINEYNSKGVLISMKHLNSESPKLNLIQNYEYDSFGYSIIYSQSEDAKVHYLGAKFDQQDRIITTSYYDRTNYCNVEINYKYDSLGNLLKKFTDYSCDSINKLGRVFAEKNEYHSINNRYEYDANGNQTFAEDLNNLNNVSQRVIRKFDSKNRLLEEAVYKTIYSQKLDFLHKNIFKYDGLNNVILKERHYRKEKGEKKESYFFGDNDFYLLTLKARKSNKKANSAKIKVRITNYEYEYDNYGNWITRTGRLKGKIISYVEREITYY